MQAWCAVKQDVLALDDLVECVPNHCFARLDQTSSAADIMRVIMLNQPADDKWFKQLDRHLLWQAALIDLKLWTNDNYRTARVIDALTEQVLAEAALFALKHIAETLQAPAVASGIDSPAAAR